MIIDKAFLTKFNAGLAPDRQYTIEQLQSLFDNMPNQRVGALFDFIRWIKVELRK